MTIRALAAALALAACCAAVPAAAQDGAPAARTRRDPEVVRLARESQEGRTKVLTGHGVGMSTADLIAFLQTGFSDETVARGLPQLPVVKTEIVNAAIQELGFQQAREAVPVLAEILSGQQPKGVARIVASDTEKLPVATIDETAQMYLRYMRFNALVALGLIGDPAALPAVREATEREPGHSFAIEGAVALGMLGDASGLAALKPYLEDASSESLQLAFGSVFYLTGRNYAVTANSSIARRREAIAQYQAWAASNAATFVPERADVLRRRAGGIAPEELPSTSLRGALRGSRMFGNFDVRWSARQYLQKLGPGSAPDLKVIAEDPMEDLDIRRAAMEWFAAADPRDARRTMKALADDENEEIRVAALRLRRDIDETIAEGGAPK